MSRISRDQMMMMVAHVASYRGTCNRLKVGAALALESRPLSVGYNGAPSGAAHCGDDCNPQAPCRNTLHAERNALAWAFKHGLGHLIPQCTLYITDSPCVDCARLIDFSGVKRVVYDRPYRLEDGINYLKANGIEVIQCQVDLVIGASFVPMPTTPAFKV